MEKKCINRRATLFVSTQMNVKKEDAERLNPQFSVMGFVPSFSEELGFRVVDNHLEPQKVLKLEYLRPEESLKVKFSSNRIDVVQDLKSSDSEVMSQTEFVSLARSVFSVVQTMYSLTVTRLALASKTNVRDDVEKINNVYRRLTNLDECPVEWRLKKVTREQCENYTINKVLTYCCDQYLEPKVEGKDDAMIETDINTMVSESSVFSPAVQDIFWSQAISIETAFVLDFEHLVNG